MQQRVQSSLRRECAVSEERLDLILHALSHPTRRALLDRLSIGPCMVRELAEPFAATRVAISKHIRILEQAQLVNRTIVGRVHQCTISLEPLKEIERWLANYRLFWNDKLASLARYVEQSDRRRPKSGSTQ
jgi:DNA-binding transcriptional ArsR family regulator